MPYDGTGYYELRDPEGRLSAKGDLNWCQHQLYISTNLMPAAGAQLGWTIVPYQVNAITGGNTL